jgi:hypothetical protein
MNSIPHLQTRRRGSGRPAFALLSVLALLALACFPVLAQAEESIGPVYDPAVPKVQGQTKQNKETGPTAKDSSKDGATAPVGGGTGGGDSGSGDPSGNSNPSTPGGTDAGQDKSGNTSPAVKGQGSQQPKISQGQPPASESAADDSSSPLVPILIAIAALAAISIGVIVIRQRRQRDAPGAPVSPKAS